MRAWAWKGASGVTAACNAGEGSTYGASAFLETMLGARDVQRVVPAARWDMDAVYSPDIAPGKMSINVRWACKNTLLLPAIASIAFSSFKNDQATVLPATSYGLGGFKHWRAPLNS